MSAKFLILPIEIKARELAGKALLAAVAARSGFEVLLGDQRTLARSIHRLPKGIYLDKSISRTKIRHYRRLKELGHLVAAWCEEGLVYRDKTAYQFERISPQSMSLVDAFFAWGDVHRADVIEAIPEARDKVYAHGNPRFDLLRQPYSSMLDADARRLNAEHGRILLVVTTFSRFNRHQGQRDVLGVLEARGFRITPDQEAYYNRLVSHIGQVFDAFQEMVPALARAFPCHTVIVRPHPSEDHERWRKAVAGIDNAKVIYQGSAEPWLCAADAVIHNASTIGVEAFLLDRPVFSYMPVVDEVFNRRTHLPNMVSTQANSVEDLLGGIRMAFEGRPPSPSETRDRRELVRGYVANTSGPLAAERIVQVLSDLHDARPPCRPDTLSYLNAWSRMTARQSLSVLRHIVRLDRNLHDYMDQKFPGLSLQEAKDHLQAISQAAGHADFVVVPHPDLHGCYVISASGPYDAERDGSLRREPLMTASVLLERARPASGSPMQAIDFAGSSSGPQRPGDGLDHAMTELKQSRLLFVNYHYIRDAGDYPYPGIHPIGMAEFRVQVESLRDRYRFASPAEVEAFVLDGCELPGPSIVPSFDDGLMDHWQAACAVLEPLDIKGAFFVCSRPGIAKRVLMVHKIQWLRAHTSPSEFATEFFSLIPLELQPTGQEAWIARAEQAYRYDSPLVARLKFALNFVLPRELVDDVTSHMFANRGIDERRFCEQTYMSEEHLRSLAERGHVVGVHGHTHAPFSRLGEGLLDDVGTNVTYLADATGRAPSWVAYPYGRADAVPDDAVLASLFRRFNLKIGLTLMGTWNIGGENPARLNRINTNDLEAVASAENTGSAKSARA